MEFLDINLTKDSSLLLPAIHAIQSPFYWRILQKPPLKNLTKICETRNTNLFMNSILKKRKSPFCWWIFTETTLKDLSKKPRETRKLKFIHE
jgi:hypothetical protein